MNKPVLVFLKNGEVEQKGEGGKTPSPYQSNNEQLKKGCCIGMGTKLYPICELHPECEWVDAWGDELFINGKSVLLNSTEKYSFQVLNERLKDYIIDGLVESSNAGKPKELKGKIKAETKNNATIFDTWLECIEGGKEISFEHSIPLSTTNKDAFYEAWLPVKQITDAITKDVWLLHNKITKTTGLDKKVEGIGKKIIEQYEYETGWEKLLKFGSERLEQKKKDIEGKVRTLIKKGEKITAYDEDCKALGIDIGAIEDELKKEKRLNTYKEIERKIEEEYNSPDSKEYYLKKIERKGGEVGLSEEEIKDFCNQLEAKLSTESVAEKFEGLKEIKIDKGYKIIKTDEGEKEVWLKQNFYERELLSRYMKEHKFEKSHEFYREGNCFWVSKRPGVLLKDINTDKSYKKEDNSFLKAAILKELMDIFKEFKHIDEKCITIDNIAVEIKQLNWLDRLRRKAPNIKVYLMRIDRADKELTEEVLWQRFDSLWWKVNKDNI